jgi:hypothetical protein
MTAWKRIYNAAAICLFLFWLGAMALLMSVQSGFKHDPLTADRFTRHVIPLEIRGTGTVYLTASEWNSIAPYQNIAYLFFGALMVAVVMRVAAEGYQGFMRGWRNSN